MNLQDIRQMARKLGLDKVGNTKRVGLVRHIQRMEGNFDCFATPQAGHRDQTGCLWRMDCCWCGGHLTASSPVHRTSVRRKPPASPSG